MLSKITPVAVLGASMATILGGCDPIAQFSSAQSDSTHHTAASEGIQSSSADKSSLGEGFSSTDVEGSSSEDSSSEGSSASDQSSADGLSGLSLSSFLCVGLFL